MPQKRYRPEEIIAKLRQADVLLGEGKKCEIRIYTHRPWPQCKRQQWPTDVTWRGNGLCMHEEVAPVCDAVGCQLCGRGGCRDGRCAV